MKTVIYSFFLAFLVLATPLSAETRVQDDNGEEIRLSKPAQRIVSLAPHVTELLYAAGAGHKLVGVVQFSDYPPAALKINKVGGYTKLDLEAIIALQPDLLVAWRTGNNPEQLAKLKRFGLPIYVHDSHTIPAIADTIEKLGQLSGTLPEARQSAAQFRHRYQQLQQKYRGRPTVRGFYQVWNQPLITVNDQGLINEVLHFCGIENVFAKLPGQFPRISIEAVLKQDPQLIIASGMDTARPEWLDDWRKWHTLQAVQANTLYFVPPSIIQRHAPRILDAIQQVCEQAEQARQKPATVPVN
ncbi:MAG: cobalamin-binding protein [Gammaproteobacteria bacterium]|nr:cobalamin-binding protein [Gammaproteobacteria bacterium]MDH5651468.1 cobalamin-binding protein [Gammaproteobacteria bacterium]